MAAIAGTREAEARLKKTRSARKLEESASLPVLHPHHPVSVLNSLFGRSASTKVEQNNATQDPPSRREEADAFADIVPDIAAAESKNLTISADSTAVKASAATEETSAKDVGSVSDVGGKDANSSRSDSSAARAARPVRTEVAETQPSPDNERSQRDEAPSSPPGAFSATEPSQADEDDDSLVFEPVQSARMPPPVEPTISSPELEEPVDMSTWEMDSKAHRQVSEQLEDSLDDLDIGSFRCPPPVSDRESLPDEADLIETSKRETAQQTADTLLWEPPKAETVWKIGQIPLILESVDKYGPVVMPTGIGYHRLKAYALGVLSTIVYEPFEKRKLDYILRKLFGANYTRSYTFEKNSAAALVVECENFLAVSWRGTDSIADWSHNLKPSMAPLSYLSQVNSGFKVHAGFLDYTNELLPDILGRLDSLLAAKARQVLITGHSLGGAAALISSLCFEPHRSSRHELNCVMTFGQPRAVNGKLAEYCNKYLTSRRRLYRYTNNNDIVPRVPPAVLGFKHVGHHLHITHEGDAKKVLRNPSVWQLVKDRATGLRLDLCDGDLDYTADHGLQVYWRISKSTPATELDYPMIDLL